MDKDVLMAQNRAAEAEQKRVAAENKVNMLTRQAGQMAIALEEAKQFIANPEKYKPNEIAALNNMIKSAAAVFQSQGIQVSEPIRGFQIFTSDPPEEPQTDDWYFDGKHFHWYYLGRWHKERTE